VIVGAGAAGLWVALEMLHQGVLKDNRLLIFEADQDKGKDRTWCFWERETLQNPHLRKLVTHSWSRVSFRTDNRVGNGLSPLLYYYVESSDFYAYAKSSLEGHKNVSFIYERVNRYLSTQNNIELTTNQYRTVKADRVFTSVFKPFFHLPEIDFWQSFVGFWVTFEDEVFTADQFTLMDFDIPQDDAVRFVYMLPVSKSKALIEVTQFHDNAIDAQKAEKLIRNVARKFAAHFTLGDKEQGKIPMSQILETQYLEHHDERITPIGTVSGAIKPSTGYGFLEMKRRAGIIAERIAADEVVNGFKRSPRFKFYDRLLLAILKSEPARGKQIFSALTKGVSPQLLFKFLDEKTSVFEDFKIFNALPVPLFLKYLFKNITVK